MSTATLPDWAKNGDGDGYGYGYGYGDGYGDGYGYGYGDGDGYGYGYGDGDGYGDGSDLLACYDSHPLVIDAAADGSQVVLALWRSDSDGQPANGGVKGEPARPGLVQRQDTKVGSLKRLIVEELS